MLNKIPNWKPTKKGETWQGYIKLFGKYDCPYSDKRGRVFEHRYVWWKHYGNSNVISKDELIHHINGIKSDNRIENLQKIISDTHNKIHSKHRTPEYKRDYKKRWAIKNRDKLNAKRRLNWKLNIGNRKARAREYEKKHPEQMKKARARYVEHHHDRILQSKKKYYYKHRRSILRKERITRQIKIRKARRKSLQ